MCLPEGYLQGDRQLQLIPVIISLCVTYVSAIMMIGVGAEAYYYGVEIMLFIVCFFTGALKGASASIGHTNNLKPPSWPELKKNVLVSSFWCLFSPATCLQTLILVSHIACRKFDGCYYMGSSVVPVETDISQPGEHKAEAHTQCRDAVFITITHP